MCLSVFVQSMTERTISGYPNSGNVRKVCLNYMKRIYNKVLRRSEEYWTISETLIQPTMKDHNHA
jgi:hypothetical protein